MFKKLALIAGMLLVVLAVACGSDKESTSDKTQNDSTPAATKKATKAAPTKEATVEVVATEEPDGDDGDSAGSLESLSFLTGGMFGGAETGSPEAADPELANMLIASTDLPNTFASVGGDMGFSMTMPQGEVKMAMRTFSQGDPNASEMTPTIVSAAMAMPPAALEEFDSQLAELDEMTTEDIQEAMGGSSVMGIEFKELSVEKVSLGDGGISMHMVMDMSAMLEELGDLIPEDEAAAMPTSFGFDMYIFKVGDVVLMAMSMLPPDTGSPVDVESLAAIMESKAQ
jgi:hypothetical protein